MASKALFVLALLLASAVLLTAATAAEQTHDKEEKVTTTNSAGVQDWHDRGGYPGRGGGGGGYPGHDGGGGYPPRCHWGCCRRGYHGGCQRCCGAADEVPEPMERPEVHN